MNRSIIALGAIALVAATAPTASAVTPPEETRVAPCATGHLPSAVKGNPGSRAMRRVTRAGDAFIYHNGAGWHLRMRHRGSDKLTFTGTIRTNDGKEINPSAYRLEPGHGDEFTLGPDKTSLTFTFNNYGGIDGLDMTMNCSADVTFELSADGSEMNPDRIHLGRRRIEALTNPVTIERRL